MILELVFMTLGLVLLVKGADFLVEGASSFAKKKNVSDLAIGLTIVAFGTSAPELVVNLIAAADGHEDIAFGNIIGSNNFNLLAILGLAGLITPLVVQTSTVWKEIPMSLGAAILLLLLANNFFLGNTLQVSRIDGLILLICFGLFLYYVYKQMRKFPETAEVEAKQMSNLKVAAYVVLGLLGLIFGGRLVVSAAMDIAVGLGMSQKIIGLTIVAAGTSLPELATSVLAAFKKKSDIAVGNVIGSNIFNIFFILGLSAVVRPLPYDLVFNRDLFLLVGGTIFLFATMFLFGKKKLDRWEAAILLSGFVLYTVFLILSE